MWDIETYKQMSEEEYRKKVKAAAPKKIVSGALMLALPLIFIKENSQTSYPDWRDNEFFSNIILFICVGLIFTGLFVLLRGIGQWRDQENDLSNFITHRLYGNWREFERCIKSALNTFG